MTFDDLAEQFLIVEGKDYQMMNEGTELALNIKAFYNKYVTFQRSRKILDVDILPQSEFTRQLGRKDYFVSYRAVRFRTRSSCPIRAYVINVDKVSKIMELSSLIS